MDESSDHGIHAGAARALVIGATGAIGAAFVEQLRHDARVHEVIALSRQSQPPIDYGDEASIGAAAQALQSQAPFARIVVATGTLHGAHGMPEKRLADLNGTALEQVFRINTFGPALLLRHFAPLLHRQQGVMALLSAKVGSIGDNRLGGWYAYRASKAALNMLVKTAAIELRRTHPGACIAAVFTSMLSAALDAR